MPSPGDRTVGKPEHSHARRRYRRNRHPPRQTTPTRPWVGDRQGSPRAWSAPPSHRCPSRHSSGRPFHRSPYPRHRQHREHRPHPWYRLRRSRRPHSWHRPPRRIRDPALGSPTGPPILGSAAVPLAPPAAAMFHVKQRQRLGSSGLDRRLAGGSRTHRSRALCQSRPVWIDGHRLGRRPDGRTVRVSRRRGERRRHRPDPPPPGFAIAMRGQPTADSRTGPHQSRGNPITRTTRSARRAGRSVQRTRLVSTSGAIEAIRAGAAVVPGTRSDRLPESARRAGSAAGVGDPVPHGLRLAPRCSTTRSRTISMTVADGSMSPRPTWRTTGSEPPSRRAASR
jgi:hypothetical protein